MPQFSIEELVTREETVDVCACKYCSMKFVYFAVVTDEDGKKSLWSQIQTESTHCPYCGEKRGAE